MFELHDTNDVLTSGEKVFKFNSERALDKFINDNPDVYIHLQMRTAYILEVEK